jgi:DNA-binding NarL/FixJ family response regulator
MMTNPTDNTTSKNDTSTQLRVIIVDDHPAIREAIAETVDDQLDMTLCGTAKSAQEAFQLTEKTKPHVAVIDISLEDSHGLDLLQNLQAQHPQLQAVVFSMYDENVYAERSLRAGALGYVMKTESTQNLAEAIRTVSQGHIYLSRRMASSILSKFAPGRPTTSQPANPGFALDRLTDREMAVFQMIGRGKTADDIADSLNLNRKTVETYRRRAKEKLGFDNVAELLQHAIQWTYAQSNKPQT